LDDEASIGLVHVYTQEENSMWSGSSWLIDYDKPQEHLGCSVALFGDSLLAGGPFGYPGGASLFVHNTSGWIRQARFDDPDWAPRGQFFGVAVALFQDIAVVGRQNAYEDPLGASGAYVYKRAAGSWSLWQTLAPADRSDYFGASIAIWGDTVAVGDSRNNVAYIYEEIEGSWQLKQILGPAENGKFGFAISMNQDKLLVGRPLANRAHLFQKKNGSWLPRNTFGDDGDAIDNFGAAVAVSADELVIGAPGSSDGGHAYVFRNDEIFVGNFE
jgi:hypothetical protein